MRHRIQGSRIVNYRATGDHAPVGRDNWLQPWRGLTSEGERGGVALGTKGLVGTGIGAGTDPKRVLDWVDEIGNGGRARRRILGFHHNRGEAYRQTRIEVSKECGQIYSRLSELIGCVGGIAKRAKGHGDGVGT